MKIIFAIGLSIFGWTIGSALAFWWGQTMYNWILK